MSDSESKKTDTISPEGDVTVSNVKMFRDKILKLINGGTNEITIDFSKVGFIDSSGIGLLVAAFNQLNKIGGFLYLVNVSKEIMKILTIMNLDKRFNASL